MRDDTILAMRVAAYSVLALGWLLWAAPFFLFKERAQTAKVVDRRARWGVALLAIAYSLLWQGRFWERPIQGWRVGVCNGFFLLASLLSWSARRALGRQWRIDAGLNADHELVTWGLYRFVRHPIYASILCTLVATGVLITPWVLFAVALVIFFGGVEIRVRVEDGLLRAGFEERFEEYRNRVPAYVPWVR